MARVMVSRLWRYLAVVLMYGIMMLSREFISPILVHAITLQIVGGILNDVAVFYNGELMPVVNLINYADDRHQPLRADTRLKILCDVIPFGDFTIVSIGDLLMLCSAFLHSYYYMSLFIK